MDCVVCKIQHLVELSMPAVFDYVFPKKIVGHLRATKDNIVKEAFGGRLVSMVKAFSIQTAFSSTSSSYSAPLVDYKGKASWYKFQGSASVNRTFPYCPKCGKNYLGEYLASIDGCFGCGQLGHSWKDCPSAKQGMGGQGAPNQATTPIYEGKVWSVTPSMDRGWGLVNHDCLLSSGAAKLGVYFLLRDIMTPIWVIVHRLTKSTHFLTVKTTNSVKDYARLYITEIVRLHGVPLSIISDRDGWSGKAYHSDLRGHVESLSDHFLGLTYEEVLVEIPDRQVRRFRNKKVDSVKALWRNRPILGATWEAQADIMAKYPHLFSSELVSA
ncbi:hypothetical protein MTR67_034651 [Solanum verrucosum]|uniref:CCHC-type domain-containing protein n=1 Tax=Solanum verrucosum TaxID=315347 RepID=A0AAF0ZIZ0_SOLVR|nr:hypothetical protein MTR67_034651 [Solanum verrucosum]